MFNFSISLFIFVCIRTLSELNLMTYDFHGSWSETTGANAPLYNQGWGPEHFSVHECVNNWLAGGGSRNKINIGKIDLTI